jgi:hypothetical protein
MTLENVRYVTDEQGERVGVLLNVTDYQRLTAHLTADPDLLTDLSQAELEALAESTLAPATQTRLDELLTRQTENQLSSEETVELDHLLEQIDQLNILKTRARYTLNQQSLLAMTR